MKRFHHLLLGAALLLGMATAQATTTPIVSQKSGTCVTSTSTSTSASKCTGVPEQQFEFTAGGSIVSGGKCLTAGKASVSMTACISAGNQIWAREADLIKSVSQNLCLFLALASSPSAAQPTGNPNTVTATQLKPPTAQPLQPTKSPAAKPWSPAPQPAPPSTQPLPLGPDLVAMASCAYNADRKWTLTGVPTVWPSTASTDKPTAAVPESYISQDELFRVVRWIQDETSISNTPFCWKKPGYDRGAGKLPTSCGSKTLQDGLCYNSCPSGQNGVGPVCWGSCPSGYKDTGALCQSTDPLSYSPGRKCSKKDKLGTCWAWKMNSCRDGYRSDNVTTCWLNKSTISKPSSTRGAGTTPNGCTNGLVLDAGLCYEYARTGYTCTATICTEQCASGSIPCGSGCAKNVGTCTAKITDMIVSPAIMLAGMVTGEGASVALKAVKSAVEDSRKMAVLGATAAELALILKDAIEGYMTAAEKDLAGIATAQVEQQLADKYTRGSPTYRHVARQYALVQIIATVADMFAELSILAISSIEPLGIVATINAFSKPMCTQHKSIP
jgi:hypothetical protein